jgi:transposase
MMIDPCVIGIDISKQHLDVFDGATGRLARIDNTEAALAGLVEALAGRDGLVVFEASGPYDGRLRAALAAAGIAQARVNPGRARHFARACGLIAKTDAIDARMLAAMGAALNLKPDEDVGDAARQRLTRLIRRRDQLVAMRQQEKLRSREADATDHDSLRRHIAFLDAEIAAVEAERDTLLRACGDLAGLERLLRSIPGIGPVAATTLLALMPELGRRSPRQVAALAGLAPFNADSGRFRGIRTIHGGRKRVRDALYMAAVSAWRSKTRLGAFAQALIDRGKPFKLAMIALARKILTIANAVIRDDKAYQP